MPRSNRPRRAARRSADEVGDLEAARLGGGRVESLPDGDWVVRTVTGSGAGKTYRCPGCDHEVVPGVSHVVAWPLDAGVFGGPGERRHWHTPCWRARERRGPRRLG